jgi:hypothetical protein
MKSSRALFAWIPGLVGAVILLALLRHHEPQIGDDAFIYFRYARNLARGYGAVFNPGERVEGYSSPLWLGLLCVGAKLDVDMARWAHLLGFVATMGTAVGTYLLARRLDATREAAGVAVLAVALTYGTTYWAGAGLETALHACLLVWTCVLAVGGGIGWGLLAGLLAFARPEGLMFTPLVAAAMIVLHRRVALRGAAIAIALTAALLAGRWLYYHAPFPNTYYAKATGALAQRLELGWSYARHTALAALVIGAFALARRDEKRWMRVAVVGIAGALVAVAIGGGGDWMFHERLLVPVFPLLAATVVSLCPGRFSLPISAAAAFVAFLPVMVPPRVLREALALRPMSLLARQEGELTDASLAAGRFIRERWPTPALIAVNHAGALPFATDYPTLDMVGLTDRHIAREVSGGLHEKWDAEYVLSRAPKLIVLNTRVRPGADGIVYHPGYWPGETALVRHPEFAAHYRPISTYFSWRWIFYARSYIVIFERID